MILLKSYKNGLYRIIYRSHTLYNYYSIRIINFEILAENVSLKADKIRNIINFKRVQLFNFFLIMLVQSSGIFLTKSGIDRYIHI